MQRPLVNLTTALSLLLAWHSIGSAQSVREAQEVFRDVEAGRERRLTELSAAIRQRSVYLDTELLLSGSVRQDEAEARGRIREERLSFTLFPDVVLQGTLEARELAHGGGCVAAFSLEDDAHGSAYISVVGEAATGTFRSNGRLFQLHHVEGGVHTLSEVDELKLPSCGALEAETPGRVQESSPGGGTERASVGQILDLLVVYTDDARVAYGGVDGINSLINLAIFESNQGYAQSDVVMRLNLVHTHEVAFSEAGSISTWLSQLRSTSDGVVDEVHALRNSYGADAVSMITASGAGFCGIGYLWTSLSSNQAPNAFSVTAAGCATGYYTFAHELGHNLGCQHDRANAGTSAIFPHAYGYRTTSGAYRSIMAYAPGTRVNIWSNPGKRAPDGAAMGAANSEENWRVLNAVVGIASGWRASRSTGHEVTTTFAGGNGFAGNMFDIRPKDDITLSGIDIHTNAPIGTPVQARVWFRNGSYVGFDRTSFSWFVLAAPSGISAGSGQPTRMDFSSSVTLHSGRTYGIYVEFLGFNGSSLLVYSNGSPTNFENDHLLLTSGVGKGVGFGSTTFPSRIWNGRMRYRGANGQFSAVTTFAGGNSFAGNMFTVTPLRNLTLNSLDLNIAGSGPVTVDVWFRTGSHVGFEYNPSSWTFLGTDFSAVAAGAGQPTSITVGDINLTAGTTYSFYVLLSSYGATGQSLLYTNGTTSFSNADLTIGAGIGRGMGAFTGSVFSPRIWNGRIRYTLL
jgi:hypothetical protein